MTTNTCAKCGFYSENRSMRQWKAIAFASGLVLGLYSGPLHAAPTSGDDAELLAMTAARTFWELPFEFPAAIRPSGYAIAGFRLRRNQLEAEKSDEPAHD